MQRRCYPVILALLLTVSSLLLNGCKPESLVSTSQEIEIGRQAAQDIESQYRLVTDPQLNAMVNTMGQAIAQCSDRPDLEYKFKILDINDVNAVSLPGGWIYVYKGLINETRNNPDQLAGVIAHEVGHVAARHHAEAIGRQLQTNILIGTLTSGDIQQIAGIAADISMLRWSRKQEFEADRLGIDYLYRCQRWNPQGLINFFGKLEQMRSGRPSQFEQIFLTHPVTEERVKRAQEYLNALRSGAEQP